MSRMAVLSMTGEKTLWLVDFAAGTVSALPDDADLSVVSESRTDGAPVTRGVDLAVTVEGHEGAFSGKYYRSDSVLEAKAGSETVTEGIDIAVSVEARDEAFSGRFYRSGSEAMTAGIDLAVAVEAREGAFSGLFYRC
jgi:hypothetical protein